MKQTASRTRQQKSDTTHQKIIDAAVDLFYKYGYEKASLQQITNKVGISQAAIFYHFRNKEQILYTIIETVSDELTHLLQSCLSGNDDPLETLKNTILQHILAIKTRRKGAKIVIEEKGFLTGGLNTSISGHER